MKYLRFLIGPEKVATHLQQKLLLNLSGAKGGNGTICIVHYLFVRITIDNNLEFSSNLIIR
jgi:hypothetical protein